MIEENEEVEMSVIMAGEKTHQIILNVFTLFIVAVQSLSSVF